MILLGWAVWTLLCYTVGAGVFSFIVMENFFNPADWGVVGRILLISASLCYFGAFIKN